MRWLVISVVLALHLLAAVDSKRKSHKRFSASRKRHSDHDLSPPFESRPRATSRQLKENSPSGDASTELDLEKINTHGNVVDTDSPAGSEEDSQKWVARTTTDLPKQTESGNGKLSSMESVVDRAPKTGPGTASSKSPLIASAKPAENKNTTTGVSSDKTIKPSATKPANSSNIKLSHLKEMLDARNKSQATQTALNSISPSSLSNNSLASTAKPVAAASTLPAADNSSYAPTTNTSGASRRLLEDPPAGNAAGASAQDGTAGKTVEVVVDKPANAGPVQEAALVQSAEGEAKSKDAETVAEKREVGEGKSEADVAEDGKLGADEKKQPVVGDKAEQVKVKAEGSAQEGKKHEDKSKDGADTVVAGEVNEGGESAEKKPVEVAAVKRPGENEAKKEIENAKVEEGKSESDKGEGDISTTKTHGQDQAPPSGDQLLPVKEKTAGNAIREEAPAAGGGEAKIPIDDDEPVSPEKQREEINIDEAPAANDGKPEAQGAIPPAQDNPKSVPHVPIHLSEEDTSSHFMTYFVTISILTIIIYVTYHNRKKILGLILEGRGAARARRSRVNYSKLRVEPLADEDASGRPDSVRDFIY